MSSIQFWLLMFSLWFSINVSTPSHSVTPLAQGIVVIGVWGSLAMVLINLVS